MVTLAGYPDELHASRATGEIEVRVRRLDGSSLFADRMQCDQTIGSLLEILKVPEGSTLMVAATPVSASSLLVDHLGGDGCVDALLVTTGLETRKFFCCWISLDEHLRLQFLDEQEGKGKGKGKGKEQSTEVFIPSDAEDPVASVNKAISEKLGTACHLDVSAEAFSEEGPSLSELASCSYRKPLTVIIEGSEALKIEFEGEVELAPERLLEELKVEYGEANPSRCYTSAKVLQKEVSYFTYAQLGCDTVFANGGPDASASTWAELPLWRPHSSRWAAGHLKIDDGRVVESGGEFEDSYDPMFCIFNDVLVKYPDGRVPELYTYPRDIFPPTDDHACLQVDNFLYLLGNVGYGQDRTDRMQILRLNLDTYQVQRIEAKGQGPKWHSKRDMIDEWKFGASGCCPGWRPPKDINLPIKCLWSIDDERAEGHVGGLFFGVVVRLKEFTESFLLMRHGGSAEDTFLVKESEVPQSTALLTAGSFEIIKDCYRSSSWIVAKLDETFGVVYQAAHYVQAGLTLELDRDHVLPEVDVQDKEGEVVPTTPQDIRVLGPDASFFGFLRERNSMEKYSGLQLARQGIPASDKLDDVTSLTPPRIVEEKFLDDITDEDRLNMCIYRPLDLFLAEAAVKQAQAVLEEGSGPSSEEAVQVARERLAQVVDQVLLLAPAEEELKKAALETDEAWQAALVKWGLASKPNPRLEGRKIVIEIYPGPTCWHLDVDDFTWHEAKT